jgi:hypothetical protein
MKIARLMVTVCMIMTLVATGFGGAALAEDLQALSSLSDDYEIVIRDSVNWFVMLNLVETDNNLIRYEGILYYTYSGREITGEAKAVYNANPDNLTIQCRDPYNETNPDYMAYGLTFDSASSRHMRGGWAYIKGKWQGGTAAQLIKGSIGAHSAD